MTNAAPEPFHNPMESLIECDLANDRVAVLEADLAAMTKERDALRDALKLIADGRWNVGKREWYDARIFAAKTIADLARYQPEEES